MRDETNYCCKRISINLYARNYLRLTNSKNLADKKINEKQDLYIALNVIPKTYDHKLLDTMPSTNLRKGTLTSDQGKHHQW